VLICLETGHVTDHASIVSVLPLPLECHVREEQDKHAMTQFSHITRQQTPCWFAPRGKMSVVCTGQYAIIRWPLPIHTRIQSNIHHTPGNRALAPPHTTLPSHGYYFSIHSVYNNDKAQSARHGDADSHVMCEQSLPALHGRHRLGGADMTSLEIK
jgi:hypothetical protein